MSQKKARDLLARLLSLADVELDGHRDWDIQVHRDEFCARVMAEGSLGLGESYMDGWWDCPRLDELFCRILGVELDSRLLSWRDRRPRCAASSSIFSGFPARFASVGTTTISATISFGFMLGKRMSYTCVAGIIRRTSTKSQEAKLELVARKLLLRPGMRILDIGCGWGGTARFLCRGDEKRAEDCRSRSGFKTTATWMTVSHFHADGPRALGARGTLPSGDDRKGLFHHEKRSLGEPLYLSEFDAPLGEMDRRGGRKVICNRGLAEYRRGLRPDSHGEAQQLPSKLESDPREIRGTLSAHVGVLSMPLCGAFRAGKSRHGRSCRRQTA